MFHNCVRWSSADNILACHADYLLVGNTQRHSLSGVNPKTKVLVVNTKASFAQTLEYELPSIIITTIQELR
jgi:hypothetical protein